MTEDRKSLRYPDRPPRRLLSVRYVDVPVDTVASGREKVVEFLESAAGKGFVVESFEQALGRYSDRLDVKYKVVYTKLVQISRKAYRSRRRAQYG